MMRKIGGLLITGVKIAVEMLTVLACLCCLSGIDAQPWQMIPGVLFGGIWLAELYVLEGGVCEEWQE